MAEDAALIGFLSCVDAVNLSRCAKAVRRFARANIRAGAVTEVTISDFTISGEANEDEECRHPGSSNHVITIRGYDSDDAQLSFDITPNEDYSVLLDAREDAAESVLRLSRQVYRTNTREPGQGL